MIFFLLGRETPARWPGGEGSAAGFSLLSEPTRHSTARPGHRRPHVASGVCGSLRGGGAGRGRAGPAGDGSKSRGRAGGTRVARAAKGRAERGGGTAGSGHSRSSGGLCRRSREVSRGRGSRPGASPHPWPWPWPRRRGRGRARSALPSTGCYLRPKSPSHLLLPALAPLCRGPAAGGAHLGGSPFGGSPWPPPGAHPSGGPSAAVSPRCPRAVTWAGLLRHSPGRGSRGGGVPRRGGSGGGPPPPALSPPCAGAAPRPSGLTFPAPLAALPGGRRRPQHRPYAPRP